MQDEIIDSEFETKPNRFEYQHYVALGMLSTGILYSISKGTWNGHPFYIGLLGLVSSIILTLLRPKIGLASTFILCLLGIIQLLNIFPSNYTFSLGLGPLTIELEIRYLLILIIHILFNQKHFSRVLKKQRSRSTKLKESKRTTSIENFKKRFANKSITELKLKVNNSDLIEEARMAAQELIKEKKNKKY